jgi:mRNA interferase HigB
MKVVGTKIISDFADQHADVRNQIDTWLMETREASWQTPSEIKARYASASFLADNVVVFNIKGNKYRLEVKVNFKNQIVLVKRMGTHAEYSKW